MVDKQSVLSLSNTGAVLTKNILIWKTKAIHACSSQIINDEQAQLLRWISICAHQQFAWIQRCARYEGFFLATFTVLFQKASTYRKINQEFRKVRALFTVRRKWISLQHSCRGQIHTEYDTIPDSCLHTLLPPQRDPTIVTRLRAAAEYFRITKKGKSGPYSITERRVPELIPVLGSQPACDVSHKPGGRLPLLSVRHAVTQATLKRGATNFAAW